MTVSTRLERGVFRQTDMRLALLVGQSISLGILLSLLIITASALFLTQFGSQALPYVYIAVAILGSLVFFGYSELQRRFPLPALSLATIGTIALFFLLSWLGLILTGAGWITFLLMVSFTLIIQMGFVLLGNQAGRLFDVREMKGKFPRVVAGFAVGFMAGGFLAALLTNVIGRTENLLLLAMVSSLSMLIFLFLTDRRFHARLVQAGSAQRRPPSKPLWQLLAKRFVLLIVLYQLLSAMVSQLLDFMVYDQAAIRFSDSIGLAQFFGNYTIGLNLSDILFLALFAGLLLSRFGLNFGMSANPVVDGVVLLVTIGVGLAIGAESGLFFILVISARILDITLTDGTTRGSINTAYQALPAHERVTVQTGVEGIGVPLALGLTGVILLLFGAFSGLTILHIAVFTLVITILWAASALLVYRGYTNSLVQTLRRRALDPTALTLEDGASLAVVESFLHSDEIREVRLALDMLEDTGHESFGANLIVLAGHHDASIRAEALSRIERCQVSLALPTVRQRLQSETEPVAMAAVVRAFCALEESGAVEQIQPYLHDDRRAIQGAAAVGLLRYGGIAGALAAGECITMLAHSPDPVDRQLVAHIIGGVESANFYQPLLALLTDEERYVRRAALDAAGLVQHPRLLPLIIDNLDEPGTRSAAMGAVVACGDMIVPHVERALADVSRRRAGRAMRLVRACGQIKGERIQALLQRHLDHPDGEVRVALLSALCSCGYRAEPDELPAIRRMLQVEVRSAVRILLVGQELGDNVATEPLRQALVDEISTLRQRVFYLLTFIYDRRAILRASVWLKSGGSVEQATALETLDVMLSGELKRMLLPLVDPSLAPEQRIGQLADSSSVPGLDRDARLAEIIADAGGVWRHPWIRTCAVYAAGKLGLGQMAGAIETLLSTEDVPLRQTCAWALYTLAPERFEGHRADLLTDPDPLVSQLVAQY